jgi:hypothetical protein
MSEPINDGGPAFPIVQGEGVLSIHGGMTLRDYFAARAPAKEIADIVPDKVGECAEFIGMNPSEYQGAVHYVQCLAKARYIWADAVMKAREAK